MFTKIKTALVSVLLVGLAFGGFSVALAASSAPGVAQAAGLPAAAATPTATPSTATTAAATPAAPTPGLHWFRGQITALGSDSFTLTGPAGGVHQVTVNDQTKYFNNQAQAGSFAGLQTGDRVLGAANVGSDGSVTAVLVIDFGAQTNYKGAGVASAVNSGEQSFTFVGRNGRVWEFYVDANTKITDRKGDTQSFSDIQVGTRLAVQAQKRADGKWWAVSIKLGKTTQPASSAATSQS